MLGGAKPASQNIYKNEQHYESRNTRVDRPDKPPALAVYPVSATSSRRLYQFLTVRPAGWLVERLNKCLGWKKPGKQQQVGMK
jgi:hypothetical protein